MFVRDGYLGARFRGQSFEIIRVLLPPFFQGLAGSRPARFRQVERFRIWIAARQNVRAAQFSRPTYDPAICCWRERISPSQRACDQKRPQKQALRPKGESSPCRVSGCNGLPKEKPCIPSPIGNGLLSSCARKAITARLTDWFSG